MKVVSWRAFVVALAAALAALVAVLPAAARTDGAAAAPRVTITFWQTMNEEETVTLNALVARFERANRNIDVRVVNVPFDQAQARYSTAAQAGRQPDVLRAEIAWIADFAARGFLRDITHNASPLRAQFLRAPWNYGVYAGKTWAIPQVTDALAILYNRAQFRARGISEPQTITQLVSACQRLGGGRGIFLRGDSYWVQGWIWAYGGGLVNPARREILVATRGSINGFTNYINLFRAPCAFKNQDFANDYTNQQTAFKSGQVGMIVNGPWATSDILQGEAFQNPANLGVAPIPRGPAGQGSPVGGHSYVIGRNTRNFAAAWRFVQFMASVSSQSTFATRNNLLPTRTAAYNTPAVKRNRLIGEFLEVMQKARNRPVHPQGARIYTDFTPNVQKALTGEITSAEALVNVANAWRAKLFRGYRIVR